jgi:hypothetical protein
MHANQLRTFKELGISRLLFVLGERRQPAFPQFLDRFAVCPVRVLDFPDDAVRALQAIPQMSEEECAQSLIPMLRSDGNSVQ